MRRPGGQPCCLRLVSREQRGHRGFTLVEAAVSTVIVGVMLTAALATVAASRRTQHVIDARSRGQMLAQALMAEILSQHFEEPDEPAPLFGREAGEGTDSRQDWDDVDDYDGWSGLPPQEKDGTSIPNLEGWRRSVEVRWVDPNNLAQECPYDTGVKRIRVTVKIGDLVVARVVAIRTEAWPDDEDDSLKVLLIVSSSGNPTAQELARKALMESWGFTVTLIGASALEGALGAAAAEVDVAYVSEEVSDAQLGTKLKNTTIGVVNEQILLSDEFGFSTDLIGSEKLRDQVDVLDNTHYITGPFDQGWVTVLSSLQVVHMLDSPYAPGLRVLANTENVGAASNNKPSLAILEPGAELAGGGQAAGRRVHLPWGGDPFDVNSLNQNGRTLMKRAIEWAAGKEAPQ